MRPKWQKLASLAQKICTLWFQFFGANFASKGYPFKHILEEVNLFNILFPEENVFYMPIKSVRSLITALIV